MLGGRNDRVEQQLSIVIAQVTLADHGVTVEQIVTIQPATARADPVVKTEQTGHSMRH